MDYRDRRGVFWRYDVVNRTWNRYDGQQWVVSASPPSRYAQRFNPSTPAGRTRIAWFASIMFVVLGAGSITLAVVGHQVGLVITGLFFMILGMASARSLLPRRQAR